MAYQTAAQIRAAVPAVASASDFPDDTLDRLVASFEEIAEDYRGVAYEPRTATDTFLLDTPRCTLVLTWSKVRSITSVTITDPAVGGSAVVIDASLYTFDPTGGILHYPTGFPAGAKIEVVYEHGFDAPPNILVEACWEYVRARALQNRSSVGRDVIAQGVEGGGTTRYSTANKREGRPTGYLDVDRLLNSLPDFRAPF